MSDISSPVPAPNDPQTTLAQLESLVVELEREGDEDYWSYREWKAAFNEAVAQLRSQLERMEAERDAVSLDMLPHWLKMIADDVPGINWKTAYRDDVPRLVFEIERLRADLLTPEEAREILASLFDEDVDGRDHTAFARGFAKVRRLSSDSGTGGTE